MSTSKNESDVACPTCGNRATAIDVKGKVFVFRCAPCDLTFTVMDPRDGRSSAKRQADRQGRFFDL